MKNDTMVIFAEKYKEHSYEIEFSTHKTIDLASFPFLQNR